MNLNKYTSLFFIVHCTQRFSTFDNGDMGHGDIEQNNFRFSSSPNLAQKKLRNNLRYDVAFFTYLQRAHISET